MVNVLSSVPIARVKFLRTVNNQTISSDKVTAEPTVSYLTVPGQHGFVDLVTVTSGVDPGDPRIGYLDLLVTDDTDVLETFGWTIRFLGSTRPTRVVAVPQSGGGVTTITVDGVSMPSVWLDSLATFTGPSGATGSDFATRTYVDGALDEHEAAPDPHPGYALDSDVAAVRQVPPGGTAGQVVTKQSSGYAWATPASGGGGSTPDATTSTKGQSVILGGTADAPTVPYNKVTGAPTSLPPSGGAGGVLGGTYPNPSFAVDMATQTKLDAVDAAKAARSANLSDLASPSTARTNLGVAYGTTAGTVAQGNDGRLSDARAWTLYNAGTAPTSGQVPAWNGTAYVPTTVSGGGGGAPVFTQSATKTANYTAAANEIVVIDTSGGTFTVTGPTGGAAWGWRWKAGTVAPTIAAPNGYTINSGATVTPGLAPSSTQGELVTYQAFGTDYQPVSGFKPQSSLNQQHGPVLNTHLLAWTYAQAFQLVSANRDANEAITTASVRWPDGSTGTFTTTTASTSFPGAIDAYNVTYVPAVGATKTVTQPAVTRDTAGAVTAQPNVTVA